MVHSAIHQAQVCSAGAIETYPASLAKLIQSLQGVVYLTPPQIKALISKAAISQQELMPWADFTHPARDSYGRNLVFRGKHFEVMVMTWLPGDFSAIHDHGAARWGAVQCFGVAKHYVYTFEQCCLHRLVAANLFPGAIHAFNHSLVDQMGNSSDRTFLSLHVYGCDTITESITSDARVFDLLEGSIQHTNGDAFFCLPEGKINKRLYGVKGDKKTTLLQHRLMRDRLETALASRRDYALMKKRQRLKARVQRMGCL